ncbi:MAG: diguanylate cyclase [Rhodospirillales bacterium]|nr:diguanylate cyclase [Rhodospirillales bacterium]
MSHGRDAAGADTLSQTQTAASTTSELAPSGGWSVRLRRVLAFLSVGLVLWLLQLAALMADAGAGFDQLRPYEVAGSLFLVICLAWFIPRVWHSHHRPSGLAGLTIGVGLTLVHLSGIAALNETLDLAIAPILLVLSIGAVSGFGLAWIGPLLTDLRAAVCAAATVISGSGLIHGIGLAAAFDQWPHGWVFPGLASIYLLSFGALLGARLADLSLVASPRSVARKERFRIIAEALPIPIVLTTADYKRIVFSNRRSRQQFAPRTDSGEGLTTDALFVHAEDRVRLLELVRRDGSVENHEIEMRRADGSTFWALIAARSVTFNGEPSILAGYYDISDRKAAEEALLASEVRYALISRAANDGIWDWDIPSGEVYYSSRWREIVGAEPNKRLSTLNDWLSRVHPEDVLRLKREIDEHIAGHTPQLDTEYRVRHGDGRYCWMQCRGIALRNGAGEPIRMAGSQSDITLRKTYEINLLNAAYEDRLTGINNRAFFTHLIDTRNSAAAIDGTAVLMFNVDQFRRINDSLGSGAGDALLIAVARRLAARVKPQDALSRLGGDEFAIWLQDMPDHVQALDMAEVMLGDLAQPYSLGDVEMPVGISVGIATPTLGDASTGADLLRNARLALDRAKLRGGGRAELFDDALLRETNLRRQLGKDLTNAERLGQIFFEYQPVVALDQDGTSRVAGFEALMRWRHPELGLIPPMRFIPLAEEAGLIGPLGLFAIDCAAKESERWDELGLVDAKFSMAVNLSTRQISDRAGIMRLHKLLDRLTLPPGRLKLEITESVLMSDPESMVVTLDELRRRGVELSLDDFGTGYSSLSYLHRFPLDTLKIDRSFVSRMCRAPEAFRLVRSIIELGHDLGLDVVAEGVEAGDEAERLRELGCDFAQGYFYSRPVSADVAEAILRKRVI